MKGRRKATGQRPLVLLSSLILDPSSLLRAERAMKAWQFHAFGDMRLDDVPEPECGAGHVVVEPICVQPSVTEAQLAQGIPTLAYDRVKRRLEAEAPLQLFGHEFCARVLEVGPGVANFRVG